jgi:hypothetical protein
MPEEEEDELPYAYAHIYDEMVKRHEKQVARAKELLDELKEMAGGGFYAPGIEDKIELLEETIANGPPPREWQHAIGLTVTAKVGGKKHKGTYSLKVVKTKGLPGYKLIVQGPRGEVYWWPGCDQSETEVFVAAGGWRHTLTRFFGLANVVDGTTKNNVKHGGEAPPPKKSIPVFPPTVE